ncbi:GTPase IMAP family member 8 [Corythoichthys intestinalis]|uniref:GTPase IMAP family member 8 n=1 Tax=Corythoichthys intestinalis TaxID=161448 RepID=UPI0025A60416|nr:GTPase IMAP family member 8 [Corythoichthys intestinalis]XP_061805294.1 GTPase IMAP family member 8-like [Nerophis lumbriciformis]
MGELSAVDSRCISQLQLILLGGRNSGKSSLGNLLLGKEEFATKERTSCLRRLAQVAGCWLTVVDTPGWWCDFSVEETARMVRREIQGSVALCSQGPHVFLVVVKAGSPFTERRRRALEEHVGLLGPSVWHYCLVVFTSQGVPEHRGDQEFSRSEALRWLKEKCEQRCHLVDLSDGSRVFELMENIQALVAANGYRVFEMEESICRAVAEEKRQLEEDAHARFLNMKTHRALMREQARPLPDIRIVLMGAKGSGKTSSLNTILGRGQGWRSSGRTARCKVGQGAAFGRQLTVVDTPGWWMNFFGHESAAFDRAQIRLGPSFCDPGPHAFLLVVRPDRTFSETYQRAVRDHLELLGGDIWSRVIVLFSFGDWLSETTAEQHVESEGEPLWWLAERCGNRTHVLNNKTLGDGFQVRELLGKIEEMVAGCGGGHWKAVREEEERLVRTMREEETRAAKRKMKAERQKKEATPQIDVCRPLTEVTLILVGGSKTGKSSCGNTLLGRECFDTDGTTTSCNFGRARVGDRTVTVMDTPSCFLISAAFLRGVASYALLVVVNPSAAFTDGHGEALDAQLAGAWGRAMVVFSHGDWLGDTGIEQRLESEGPMLRGLVDKCGNRYHVLDNKRRGDGSQVLELIAHVERMLVEENHAPIALVAPPCNTNAPLHNYPSLMPSDGDQLSNCLKCGESSTESLSECSSVDLSESSKAGKQVVHRSAMWNRGNDTSCLLAILQHRLQSIRVNAPPWLHADQPRLPTMLLVLPQFRLGLLPEIHAQPELALCSQSEDWSSLEDLEAFIDSYFDTLLEWKALISPPPPPRHEGATAAPRSGDLLLSSIERKLSKLDLLEEIREDLAEVRRSLERSWTLIQELRSKK